VEQFKEFGKGARQSPQGVTPLVCRLVAVREGTVETEKKRKGRPRQARNSIQFWMFARAGRVMCVYDEARERGDKHSVAVRYAVELLKQSNPEMPISQTEVKRILAAWRPRNAGTILRFERETLTEEDMRGHRFMLEQLADLQGKKDLGLEVPTNYEFAELIERLTVRFAERPNYPRHNRKTR